MSCAAEARSLFAMNLEASARDALLVSLIDPQLRGVVLHGSDALLLSDVASAFAAFVEQLDDLRFCRLPHSIDRERMLGGIDFEGSIHAGRRVSSLGLLDRAEGGWLRVERLALHDPWILGLCRQALENNRTVRMLATAPTSDGSLLRPLASDLALHIEIELTSQALDREARLANTFGSETRCDDEERGVAKWSAHLREARARISKFEPTDAELQSLSDTAMELGVEGLRAVIDAWRAARAHAALQGAPVITAADLAFARRVVLEPRRRSEPEAPPSSEPRPEKRNSAPSQPPEGAKGSAQSQSTPSETIEPPSRDAADVALPMAQARTRGHSGRSVVGASERRGRAQRSRVGFRRGAPLAIAATLRRAASRAEALNTKDGALRLRIRKEDLCRRIHQEKRGLLHVLIVDASGSMARSRIQEAKGQALSILKHAYVHRDRVALIVLRGQKAELVLPPTSALARARRILDLLPTGGGTPLASGLALAHALITRERRRDVDAIALIFTDGRANVSMTAPTPAPKSLIHSELTRLAVLWRSSKIPTRLIDPAPPSLQTQDLRTLTHLLNAD